MRILTGRFKGVEIPFNGSKDIRPLTSRLRKAIVDSLGTRLNGAVVYDIFAGTGAFGLEALSNGAAHAVFVDRSRNNCASIARLAKTIGCGAAATVLNVPYHKIPHKVIGEQRPDIVFADPPYKASRDDGRAGRILAALIKSFNGSKFHMLYRLFARTKVSLAPYKTLSHGQDNVRFFEIEPRLATHV